MKNIIKKIIISVLCAIVFLVVWYMLYTYNKFTFDVIVDCFGSWYIGKLIGKFVDWLCDDKETK